MSFDRAYILLAAAVFAIFAVHVSHHDYVGDFWEHAAVVRELAAHPLSPANPLIATRDPHPMFSPYTLAVAAIVRMLGVAPTTALAAAGLANFAMLAIALRAFAVRLAGRGAAFFALLFTLFLWGHAPWFYSGFLHVDALGYTLSYPSTIAIAAMLGAFALELDVLRGRRSRGRLVVVAVAAAFVLVTHPLTAIATVIGMLALALDGTLALAVHETRVPERDDMLAADRSSTHAGDGETTTFGALSAGARNVAWVAVTLVGAVALASAWPYYPLWELLTTGSGTVHETNRWMYVGARATFVQLYAAAFGLPLLIARLRRNPLDALVWTFAGLAVVYAYGGATERWAYGRVLSSMVLVVHLAAADWTARTLRDLRAHRRPASADAAWLAVLACLLVAMAVEFRPTFDRYLRGRDVVTADRTYGFLEDHVPEGAVVLAKPALRVDVASYVVAAYGGKVVATPVLMLVDDASERLADARRFFHPQTPQALRREIIARYGARYFLLQGSAYDDELRWAWDLGSVVYNDEDVLLFEVTPTP